MEKSFEELTVLLKERFSSKPAISVTVDIWSDRTMRGFLRVTAHYFHAGCLTSSTLAVQRFMGNIKIYTINAVTY